MRLDARLHDLLRQDAPAASDVDLLAVVRPGRPITRALYREWEDKARAWDGREVELHFVHLPMADDRVSGSWADGVRESQEVVELALKGLLRVSGIEPPRIHDVSEVLMAEK